MKPLYAQAGDVFFTRSESLLGKAIRWAETDPGEEPTWANHTGVVVEDGYIGGLSQQATVIEALWKTRRGPLVVNGVAVRVFRPVPQYDPLELQRFRLAAGRYVGDTYGWWKLLFHLADRAVFKGVKTFSRMLRVDERPICSYLAAKVNDSARQRSAVWPGFGVMPETATPDEMLDFCEGSKQWREVV